MFYLAYSELEAERGEREREKKKQGAFIIRHGISVWAKCVLVRTSVVSRLRQRTDGPALSSTFGIILSVTFSYSREWVEIGLLVQG